MRVANLNIGTRLAIGFGILLFLILAISIIGFIGITGLNNQVGKIVNVNNPKMDLVVELADSINQRIIEVNNLVHAKDDKEKNVILEKLKWQAQQYNDNRDGLTEMFKQSGGASEAEKNVFTKIQEQEATITVTVNKLVPLVMLNRIEEIPKALGEVNAARRATLENTKELVSITQRMNDAASVQAVKDFTWARNLSFVATLVAIVIGILSAIFITRSIVQPLTQAVTIATRVAKGDFTSHINVTSGGEIGRLMVALKEMNESLSVLIRRIRTTSEQISRASSTLAASASQLLNRSNIQNDAAASMAAAVEELTVSVNEISQHANDAYAVTLQSNQLAEEGGKIIQDAMDDINMMSHSVQESSQLIEKLSEKSSKIVDVVFTIKGVAEQTNLLALNAAIEAARAGNEGRGFAVVADEVRKLAESTAQSTLEISEMVDQIRDGINETLVSMNDGVKKVSGGMEKAGKASHSVGQINSGAERVVMRVNDISVALKEQGETSSELAKNVEKIAQMAYENRSAVEETTKEAQHLEALGKDLIESVMRFKV